MSEPEDREAVDPNATIIDVRGTPVHVLRGGDGPTLLILHGASDGGTWTPFMRRMARSCSVVAPRHPGFGGVEPPAWLDRVSDLANFTLDLLDQLDLRDVHLVGFSLGGWIAADLAIRDCGRLASLTLVDAAGLHIPGLAGVDTFLSNDAQSVRDLFHDPGTAEAAAADMLRPETEDIRLMDRITVAKLAWQPRYHDPDLPKWLHRIKVPTLIAWGEEDRVFPKEHAILYQRLIPGARLMLIPECGHLPQMEKPDALAAALTSFLRPEGAAA